MNDLEASFPTRKAQLHAFHLLLRESMDKVPPLIYVHGPAFTGKSSLVQAVFHNAAAMTAADNDDGGAIAKPIGSVYVHGGDCATMAVLYEQILQKIALWQRTIGKRDVIKQRSHAASATGEKACGTIYELVERLSTAIDWDSFNAKQQASFYIILDEPEFLADVDATAFAVLLRLQELISERIGLILISRHDWCHKFAPIANGQIPMMIYFDAHQKDRLNTLLVESLKQQQSLKETGINDPHQKAPVPKARGRPKGSNTAAKSASQPASCAANGGNAEGPAHSDQEGMIEHFVGIVNSLTADTVSDLGGLQRVSRKLYPIYLDALNKGCTTATKLHRHIVANGGVSRVNLEDFDHCATMMSGLTSLDKFILIAAFLASFTPASSDRAIFGDMRQRNRAIVRSRQSIRSQQQSDKKKSRRLYRTFNPAPKAFALERMIAIFYHIVSDPVPPVSLVHSQVASLVSRGLMLLAGGPIGRLDQAKYKINLPLTTISAISASVELDLKPYVADLHIV